MCQPFRSRTSREQAVDIGSISSRQHQLYSAIPASLILDTPIASCQASSALRPMGIVVAQPRTYYVGTGGSSSMTEVITPNVTVARATMRWFSQPGTPTVAVS